MDRPAVTILIAEDEEVLRELYIDFLAQAGYAVLSVESGEEALRIRRAYAGRIDLLLADINLAGQMNGYELSDRLTETCPNLKILYISGFLPEATNFDQHIHQPGRSFLQKPFHLTALLHTVTELLS